MGYQLWIPDALRDYGFSVRLKAGWETRGSVNFNPVGVMAHHTGVNNPIPDMLANGRADLSGPLCNVEFGQDGVVTVIAAGRARHAGRGKYAELSGNSYWLGIEADSDGKQVSETQRARYPELCAALLRGLGREGPLCGHKEYAGSRGKWDPGNWDMDDMRQRTALALRGRQTEKSPTPKRRSECMFLAWHKGTVYLFSHDEKGLPTRTGWGMDPALIDGMKAAGIPLGGEVNQQFFDFCKVVWK